MRFRPILVPVLSLAVVSFVACGSGASDHDQAVEALERATQASSLETEMAALVTNVPVAAAGPESKKFKISVNDLDSKAETLLASTDTGQEYDQKISTSVEETRGAGTELAAAAGKPDALGPARKKAIGRLSVSNESLSQATKLIGTDLADDNGELSQEDADALEQTLVAVDDSGAAVDTAGSVTATPVSAKSPVTTDGLGPMSYGLKLDEAEAAGGIKLDLAPAYGGGPECRYATSPSVNDVQFMYTSGIFTRMDTGNPLVKTLEGIGVGATEAEVSEAYGGRIKSTPNIYQPDTTNELLYVPKGSDGTGIKFFAVDGRVRYITAGRLRELKLPEGCI